MWICLHGYGFKTGWIVSPVLKWTTPKKESSCRRYQKISTCRGFRGCRVQIWPLFELRQTLLCASAIFWSTTYQIGQICSKVSPPPHTKEWFTISLEILNLLLRSILNYNKHLNNCKTTNDFFAPL